MAREDNLKPFQPGENARTMGAKGGRASGGSRRRKANLRKAANEILANKMIKEEKSGNLVTAEEALVLAMLKKALAGDVGAYKALMATVGADGGTELDIKEQKARIKRIEAEAELARKRASGETEEEKEEMRVYILDDIPEPGKADEGEQEG